MGSLYMGSNVNLFQFIKGNYIFKATSEKPSTEIFVTFECVCTCGQNTAPFKEHMFKYHIPLVGRKIFHNASKYVMMQKSSTNTGVKWEIYLVPRH